MLNHKPEVAPSGVHGSLDSPSTGDTIYDQAISLAGWVYVAGGDPAACVLRAYLDQECVAATNTLFFRSDVSEHLGLSRPIATGFRMLGRVSLPATAPYEATLSIRASWGNESPRRIVAHEVRVVPALLRERAYGEVVPPDNGTVLHREHIYGSGPPVEEPGGEIRELVLGYLPEGASIVDVGCGGGAFGPALTAAGHTWLGLETNPECFEILLRRGLPFRRVEPVSGALPCSDGEWDCAICIEVLEHVADPEAFVREIARTVRGRALFSVPNLEVLPYMHGLGVVPWHILEADHKNFFTRASLGNLLRRHFRDVEVFSYGEQLLKTLDGIPLHMHLFAMAEK